MLIAEMRHRIECLGWKILSNEKSLPDGCWRLIAQSCGHTIVVLADSPRETWSAACAMALKLTRNGWAKPLRDT